MISGKTLIASLAALAAGTIASAATVTGSFSYDGVAVAAVHSDIQAAVVRTYDYGTGHSTWGTVDLGAATYRIEDVPAGNDVLVQLELDRSQPANNDGYDGGDLIGYKLISVASASDALSVDISLRSVLHFSSPLDSSSAIDGSFGACPVGGAVDSPVTVRWDAVPRATSYSVSVRRQRCDHSIIESTPSQQSTTEISVTLGTAPNEDHVAVWLECSGSSGDSLCFMPYLGYSDAFAQIYAFHARGAATGRGTDHEDGYFLPAVANLAGVAPTYWSSSLTVVNLDDSTQDVELVLTPQDVDGWTEYESRTVVIPALTARRWDNVMLSLFAATGAGSLEVRGHDLAISSRTSTPAPAGGSYGLGVPVLAENDLLSSPDAREAFAGGVAESAAWRTNLGLCEVAGRLVQVKVTVYDESMNALGSRNIDLTPYENTQVNRVVRDLTDRSSLSNGIVGVEVVFGSGKVAAYLTVIDATTGDSTYSAVRPQSPTGG
ncbi:MAG: hypothetical protein MUE90_06240 [Thermoanaerobaculales bacterium]|nr:hypothetical protein [Thermoanaerobaculales bacterium]